RCARPLADGDRAKSPGDCPATRPDGRRRAQPAGVPAAATQLSRIRRPAGGEDDPRALRPIAATQTARTGEGAGRERRAGGAGVEVDPLPARPETGPKIRPARGAIHRARVLY